MANETIVLAISRQIGSGGAYIAQTVARRLGLRYVDREILHRAAEMLGADEDAVEKLEERRVGFWSRLFPGVQVGAPDAPFVPPPLPDVREGQVIEVESRIIRDIAATEDAVIVGRGAPHILPHRPGIVRVFVHAPAAWRIAEAQRAYGLGADAARDLVRESDTRRAKFVQSLIGRSWTDACLYDFTVDSSVVPIEIASEALIQVLRRKIDGRLKM